ncbi:hypothetical protein H5410_050593 [Solanum commersonii]|uniref:Uncharacterized protein n=1 Tax=Solanum commersonii TaxID=4109 RepID=A0A9J5WYC4_SOLCO|nr:hypothetical protein H5410_050593 [Solanum commersonii]
MDHHLSMYNVHYETGAGLKPEFIDGVRDFIEHTMTLDIFKNNGLIHSWFICTIMDLSLDILYGLIKEKEMDEWWEQFLLSKKCRKKRRTG